MRKRKHTTKKQTQETTNEYFQAGLKPMSSAASAAAPAGTHRGIKSTAAVVPKYDGIRFRTPGWIQYLGPIPRCLGNWSLYRP